MKKVFLFALVSLTVISCKKETTNESTTTESTAPVIEAPAIETPEAGDGQTVTLAIAGDDAMKFDKTEFRVPAGSTVELTLTHVGKMSKESMGHNWVLLKKDVDLQTFAMNALNHKDTDYIPAETNDVITHTKLLGGGESDTITFQAPEPGTYTFLCSFPGHFGSMNGKLIVE